jgi:hypothetical protein
MNLINLLVFNTGFLILYRLINNVYYDFLKNQQFIIDYLKKNINNEQKYINYRKTCIELNKKINDLEIKLEDKIYKIEDYESIIYALNNEISRLQNNQYGIHYNSNILEEQCYYIEYQDQIIYNNYLTIANQENQIDCKELNELGYRSS